MTPRATDISNPILDIILTNIKYQKTSENL